MSESDAFDLIQLAFWVIVKGSGPAVGTAMLVGIGVALLQALTQVQEMTLTFVPKIIAILVVLVLSGPFIGEQMLAFTQNVYSRIEKGF
ncbi:MAG: flagellar biosynthetic protein FliQ [Beijerinckiaceae bacterium]|jgi:flagellar biosynthesis protein FliQ|nr:flagellar biosynthetic protein FliQ [Beijerinckiaceae bacterium]MDO9440546.1 flagellar biosynthesis protein FliQ [Beijerinckiaceae bacterium]